MKNPELVRARLEKVVEAEGPADHTFVLAAGVLAVMDLASLMSDMADSVHDAVYSGNGDDTDDAEVD